MQHSPDWLLVLYKLFILSILPGKFLLEFHDQLLQSLYKSLWLCNMPELNKLCPLRYKILFKRNFLLILQRYFRLFRLHK